ncbi:hypothetical protein THARTR1_07415 [Trichoderma harzianum]|uniref:DASH complex subunit DAD4 n=1 Tax=Trichoderma harzianum TaxID=5544 RepID=A0A2K0U358_TRIHA|nr:hypothetical protein THARTR1_07415 [Trichoderma harzianum]
MNKSLQVRMIVTYLFVLFTNAAQEINVQNMNVELVAQMFKNYQSNVLFHLEATDNLKPPS